MAVIYDKGVNRIHGTDSANKIFDLWLYNLDVVLFL